MSHSTSLTEVPKHLKARSPDRLRRLMIANNLRFKRKFNYDVKFADGFWFAWFYFDDVEFMPRTVNTGGIANG